MAGTPASLQDAGVPVHIGARRRGKDSSQLRHHQHPMNLANGGNRGDYPLSLCVEDNYLTGAEMGDEEAVRRWVQALAIEAREAPGRGTSSTTCYGRGGPGDRKKRTARTTTASHHAEQYKPPAPSTSGVPALP